MLIIITTSKSMLGISGGEKCSLFATSKSHSFLLDPIFFPSSVFLKQVKHVFVVHSISRKAMSDS